MSNTERDRIVERQSVGLGRLWLQVKEGESEMLFLLPQLMLQSWGRRGVGLEGYLNRLYKSSRECGSSVDVELLVKRQAGNWSKWKRFWWYAERGQETLAERLMAALRRIDTYTGDFDERLALRQAYLNQLVAGVVGLLLTVPS